MDDDLERLQRIHNKLPSTQSQVDLGNAAADLLKEKIERLRPPEGRVARSNFPTSYSTRASSSVRSSFRRPEDSDCPRASRTRCYLVQAEQTPRRGRVPPRCRRGSSVANPERLVAADELIVGSDFPLDHREVACITFETEPSTCSSLRPRFR